MADTLQTLTDWLITTIAELTEMEEEDTMKVTITPAGGISFEDVDIDQALQIAGTIQAPQRYVFGLEETSAEFQARKDAWQEAHPEVPRPEDLRPRHYESMELSPALRDVYEHLVDTPQPEGLTAPALAEVFGINTSTMRARLVALEARGLAERVTRGVWRAV